MRPVEKNLGKLEWKLGIARQRFEGIKEDSSIKDSRFSGICTWIIAIHVAAALACSAAAAPNGSGHKSTGGSGSAPPTGTLVTIQNLNSGLCVDTGGSIGITALIQAPCSGATTQNFVLQSSPASGYDYLVSSASSLCWDVAGGSNAPGALIQQYTCTSSSAEYYKLSQVNSGVYKILSGNMSNGCVDIVGAATSSGAAIEQNTCNGSASQIFQVSASGTRVSISVSPTSGTISSGGTQQFSATVTGSTNTAVTWSSSLGAISSTGLYTAPTVSNTTVTVKATSQADTTKSASATLTISGPTAVTIAISPTTGMLTSGGTQQFAATVTGSTNTAVTWASTDGSISASGLYTAPAVTVAADATVTVTSQADPTKSASAAVTINPPGTGLTVSVTNFGATGNGTNDDTAAIKAAIATLTGGSTLLFPCGAYLTTSALTLNVSNVTVDGSSCATIRNSSGSGGIMVIGGSGNGNPNYGSAVALSTAANELSTSFTTVSSLGVSAGDYVLLKQGGQDSSTGSGNTGCDPSGCRGELVKVASVSGNTVTVTTALHDTYDPSVNAATAQKLVGPVTSITVKNITFDGSGLNVYGLEIAGVAESTISGVTVKNVQGSALLNRGDFNVAWSNITVTRAGSAQCGSAAWFEGQGNLSVNGLSISSENQGTGSGCLANGAFGFELIQSANGTISNVTVDASGAYGRPFKTTAARWNTFNSLTVKNGVAAYNGVSLEYYSSRNTYNSCVVTNNGAGAGTANGNAGINTFGNFNQYNSFVNCTVTGNGNVQFLVNNYDALRLGMDIGNTINGGTYTGTNTAEPAIAIYGSNAYVTSAYIYGPGADGLYLGSTNGCVNNNVFGAGTNLGAGIYSSSSSNVGANDIMNGNSSNLTAGTCTGH